MMVMMIKGAASLVKQTPIPQRLRWMYFDHQHAESRASNSGHYSLALWNAMIDYVTRMVFSG